MARPKAPLELTVQERADLERIARRRKVSQATSLRARIVLECAKGMTNIEVADKLGVNKATVGKWRSRFVKFRFDGLLDEPRPGAPRKIADEIVEEVVVKTLETQPENATHWTSTEMAKKCGISPSSVQRIWRAFGLKPHRCETFTLSTDPLFVEKVRDVVGLYMHPPHNAVVLCVDEKSQIQALDRRQPLLPMMPGQAERKNYDYLRHGTTSLFAALDVATGNVIGRCYRRHRAVDLRRFLREVEKTIPDDLDIHLVMDNYGTHKSKMIKTWLSRRPRFQVHFTPTHSSWLNLVESWFSILTRRKLKRGVHTSVSMLEKDIRDFIDAYNDEPTNFTWTASADQILESVSSYCTRTLEALGESG